MKHADEGTLHAYLDGELSPDEVTELERHISVCAPCRALLTEAKGFLAESDSLVLALDVPVAARPRQVRRRVRGSDLAWAAMVVLALGTGYALRPALGPKAAESVIGEENTPSVAMAPEAAPAANGPSTPAAPVIRSQSSPAPSTAKTTTAPAADVSPMAGAGVSTPGEQREGVVERNDVVAPQPAAPALPAPTRAPVAQAPLALTYIDGTPVDTTSPRINFGRNTSAPPKRITLDEAVTRLGGSIRLIDGLAPQRVEVLAGVDVNGADPDREVIRVYYEEPDLGLVTLDQQRPAPSFAARDSRTLAAQSEAPASAITVNPLNRSNAAGVATLRSAVAMNSVSWRTDGVWLSLSSRLTGDALAQLQARVK